MVMKQEQINCGWHHVTSSYIKKYSPKPSMGHWWINYGMGDYETISEDVLGRYLIKKNI